jgi:hypothetical protein
MSFSATKRAILPKAGRQWQKKSRVIVQNYLPSHKKARNKNASGFF